MKQLTVIKHYSIGSYGDLESAEKRRSEIAERYPDRTYVIMVNARASGYWSYKVQQIRTVTVDMPERRDVYPEPKLEDFGGPTRYADYHSARLAWGQHVQALMRPILRPVTEKMNP